MIPDMAAASLLGWQSLQEQHLVPQPVSRWKVSAEALGGGEHGSGVGFGRDFR
jgi:hypothetical protein